MNFQGRSTAGAGGQSSQAAEEAAGDGVVKKGEFEAAEIEVVMGSHQQWITGFQGYHGIMIPTVYYDILCDEMVHSKFYDIEGYPTSLTQSYAMFAISPESPIVVKDGRFWPLNPEVSESPAWSWFAIICQPWILYDSVHVVG